MPARRDLSLRAAAAFFALGSIVHNADHFRRGTSSVTTALLGAGYAAMVVSAAVLVLVFIGHPKAPVVAATLGLVLAIGFAAAHWLPTWSALSDSFVSKPASGFSKFASLLEIAGALTLSAAGVAALRRERRA